MSLDFPSLPTVGVNGSSLSPEEYKRSDTVLANDEDDEGFGVICGKDSL